MEELDVIVEQMPETITAQFGSISQINIKDSVIQTAGMVQQNEEQLFRIKTLEEKLEDMEEIVQELKSKQLLPQIE